MLQDVSCQITSPLLDVALQKNTPKLSSQSMYMRAKRGLFRQSLSLTQVDRLSDDGRERARLVRFLPSRHKDFAKKASSGDSGKPVQNESPPCHSEGHDITPYRESRILLHQFMQHPALPSISGYTRGIRYDILSAWQIAFMNQVRVTYADDIHTKSTREKGEDPMLHTRKKTRRLSLLLCSILLFCAPLTFSAVAAEPVFIPDSGQALTIDGAPRVYDLPVANYAGYTLLPLRSLVSDLGVPNDDEHIRYDAESRSVTLISADGRRTVWLQQGNTHAWRDEDGARTDISLDCPVQNHASRLFVPVRFVAQALGLTVGYDAESRTVLIRTPQSLDATRAAMALAPAEKPPLFAAEFSADFRLESVGSTASLQYTGLQKTDSTDAENILKSTDIRMQWCAQTQVFSQYEVGGIHYDMTNGVLTDPLPSAWDALATELLADMLGASPWENIPETLSEELALRLLVREGGAPDEIVLCGELSSIYGPTAEMTVSGYWLELTVNSYTGFPVSLLATVTGQFSDRGAAVFLDGTMEITFTYDPALSVTIPPEVLDAAGQSDSP